MLIRKKLNIECERKIRVLYFVNFGAIIIEEILHQILLNFYFIFLVPILLANILVPIFGIKA